MKSNIALGIILAFFFNSLGPIPTAKAEPIYSVEGEFHLPAPGVLVHLSPEFNPPILKGIKVHPDDPFRFEFILDTGDGTRAASDESTRLIKYFLAGLTIPEKDLWVNLSPYEKDRVVPESFGRTEMGRDLLAEDYMLKQVTASLIYPEDAIGKKFWKRIYEEAAKKFGTTNIPVNTFNKVWIVPAKAVVYENAKTGTAYVVESKLKVMLEQDYLALEKNQHQNTLPATSALGNQIVREIVIPELTKEINANKNFAQLRQVYNSLILATWYKKKIKDSILAQVYANKNKVAGISIDDPKEKQKIYERYLQAFKKGVYNYIKEDQDPMTQATIPRKYFSGGGDFTALDSSEILKETTNGIGIDLAQKSTEYIEDVRFDKAMALNASKAELSPAEQGLLTLVNQDQPAFIDLTQRLLQLNGLNDVVNDASVHQGALHFWFDQIAYLDNAKTYAGVHNKAVIYRINGEFLAARIVDEDSQGDVKPVVTIPISGGKVLQILDREDFVNEWGRITENDPRSYNTVSSPQQYIRAIIEKKSLEAHGKQLMIKGILGQGLEGIVFLTEDTATGRQFALKTSYKDLRGEFDYWQNNMRLLTEEPGAVEHLVPFESFESYGSGGSSILMDYAPGVNFDVYISSLQTQERLRVGVSILAQVANVIQIFHRHGMAFGDIGAPNILINKNTGKIKVEWRMIDPFPDAYKDIIGYQRQDIFQVFHMLYWLVTGQVWPQGTYEFRQSVMQGEYDPMVGQKIFTGGPLSDDPLSLELHSLAVDTLGGKWEGYAQGLEKLEQYAGTAEKEFAMLSQAGRLVPGTSISEDRVVQNVSRALNTVSSGIMLPLLSLPSHLGEAKSGEIELGMGDTGPVARAFVDFMAKAKQKLWMMLPNNPTDDANCPYRAVSVFALDLKTIPPQDLERDGWITTAELKENLPPFDDPSRIDVTPPKFNYKRKLLELAYQKFKSTKKWQEEFNRFKTEESDWLDTFAAYMVIGQTYPQRWTQWPEGLKDQTSEEYRSFVVRHQDEIEQEKFSQFLAQHYWDSLAAYAAAKGVAPVLDMPIYSMHGSADVYGNRNIFMLDAQGNRTVVGGSPKDMFSPESQAWNHPMYQWDKPETVEFWVRKFKRLFRLAGPNGFVRVDNFISLVTPWAYHFEQPVDNGWRQQGRFLGNVLISALEKEIPGFSQRVIVEDLGVVTPQTAEVRDQMGLPGMKVLQFIPFEQGQAAIEGNMYNPNNFARGNLAVPMTHDTPNIIKWWRKLNADGRRHFQEFIFQQTGSKVEITDKNVAAIFNSYTEGLPADKVILSMQDVIIGTDGVEGGQEMQLNDPGASGEAVKKNWVVRFSPQDFNESTQERLSTLADQTNRSPSKSIERFDIITKNTPEVQLAIGILEKGDDASRSLAQKLEGMVQEGLVRNVPLQGGLLSAVYTAEDGREYLLISNSPSVGDYLSTEQKAVSLVRGLEKITGNKAMSSYLSNLNDGQLLDMARQHTDVFEEQLHQVAEVAPAAMREQMITFMGELMDPQISQKDGVSSQERQAIADIVGSQWHNIWVTQEQRGTPRSIITRGIINGDFPGTKGVLKELRWRVLTAFGEGLQPLLRQQDRRKAIAQNWVDTIDKADILEKVLFSQDSNFHDAQGLSGVLGLRMRLERMNKPLDFKAHFNYVRDLIRQGAQGSTEGDEVLKVLEGIDTDNEGLIDKNEQLDSFLRVLESGLFKRLAKTMGPAQTDPSFPSRVDLQMHSYYSDGTQSIANIIYNARRLGRTTIAITDHQSLGGILQAIELGDILGVHVVPAVEVYSGAPQQGGETIGDRRDILVYFPDREKFKEWMRNGKDAETDQILAEGMDPRLPSTQWGNVNVSKVVAWARSHGGAAVLAHPGKWYEEDYYRNRSIAQWGYEDFEKLFLTTGLAGIEISHPFVPLEATHRYMEFISRYNERHPDTPIVFTMGTDSHNIKSPLGQGRMTKELVDAVAPWAKKLVPAEAQEQPERTIERAILQGLENYPKRIPDQGPLTRAHEDVLLGRFGGMGEGPILVRTSDGLQVNSNIKAGVKMLDGLPVIVAANPTNKVSWVGKEWGIIDLPESLGISADNEYNVRDLITGARYHFQGKELMQKGLVVGIAPHSVQILALIGPNQAMITPVYTPDLSPEELRIKFRNLFSVITARKLLASNSRLISLLNAIYFNASLIQRGYDLNFLKQNFIRFRLYIFFFQGLTNGNETITNELLEAFITDWLNIVIPRNGSKPLNVIQNGRSYPVHRQEIIRMFRVQFNIVFEDERRMVRDLVDFNRRVTENARAIHAESALVQQAPVNTGNEDRMAQEIKILPKVSVRERLSNLLVVIQFSVSSGIGRWNALFDRISFRKAAQNPIPETVTQAVDSVRTAKAAKPVARKRDDFNILFQNRVGLRIRAKRSGTLEVFITQLIADTNLERRDVEERLLHSPAAQGRSSLEEYFHYLRSQSNNGGTAHTAPQGVDELPQASESEGNVAIATEKAIPFTVNQNGKELKVVILNNDAYIAVDQMLKDGDVVKRVIVKKMSLGFYNSDIAEQFRKKVGPLKGIYDLPIRDGQGRYALYVKWYRDKDILAVVAYQTEEVAHRYSLGKANNFITYIEQFANNNSFNQDRFKPVYVNKAMLTPEHTGGIDLTPVNMNLQTRNSGEGIKFHLDPAMLARLQNAPGLIPVIISIQPMTDLRHFLGL